MKKIKSKEHSLPHHGLSKKQKESADQELKKLRFERLKQTRSEQKIYAELLSLKFNIVDYLESGIFSEKYLFSAFLKKYVSILGISRRKLADNLGLHESKFSRIINNKENPGVGILYRIEAHSNGILTASLLWQIVTKKIVVEIENNSKEKRKQSKMVKNKLNLKIA